MKVVILAGGRGSRLSEETDLKPKPMVEIGGRPMIWHIMKHYAHYGFNEFFIALGYKGEIIKRYFLDYYSMAGSMTIKLSDGTVAPVKRESENWTVHLMDTGLETNTGGRIKRLQPWLGDETFMVTYGDGVSDLNLADLLQFHKSHGRTGTVTAVRPPARYGGLIIEGDVVVRFTEKPQIGEGWINGGFFIFESGVFKFLLDDNASLELNALEPLALKGELVAYKHERFWQSMDTLREVRMLESLWQSGKPPWRLWE